VKKFLLIPLAIILVTALIFGGCKPAAEVPEEIRVGASVALTGMFSGFEGGGAWGLEAAVDDINKQGGLYVEEYGTKLPVRLIMADNESDALKAGTLAEDLILRDNVNFLAQTGSPQPAVNSIAMMAERYQVPYFAVAGIKEQCIAVRAELSPPWEYTWQCSFAIVVPYPPGSPSDKPGYTLADTTLMWLTDIADQTNKSAGVFATDEPDGRGWYSLFPGILEEVGFTVCGLEKELGLFPLGSTDLSPLIQEWMDCDVDLLMGNAPGVDTGVLLRQCHSMGFKPKAVWAGRGALFYVDVNSWGGDIPNGICVEAQWRPTFNPELCPGIGDTTPMSLYERWHEDTGQPLNHAVSFGYIAAQAIFDAVETVGTLDAAVVNEAIGETDMDTIIGPIWMEKDIHFAGFPMSVAQWRSTDQPWVWECPLVYTVREDMGPTEELIFPIPYD